MHRRSSAIGLAVALAALGVPTTQALAQTCAAFPTMAGEGSVGAVVSFPNGGTGLGVDGSWNWPGPIGIFASFTLERPDEEDVEDLSIFGGGVAYEVGQLIPAVPEWMTLCPVAAVNFSSLDGSTTLAFPLGIGFATPFELTPDGLMIIPHLMPQFVLTRISASDISVSDHNFGIGFGALARFGALYGGASFNRLFVDSADIDWALRAGLTFAWQR